MKTIDIVSRISKALEKRDGTPDQAAKKIVEAVNVVKNYSAHQLSTAQDADELMPCPFCGSAAHFDHNDAGWWWIECSGCHVATEQSVSLMDDCKVKLCEMWNRRPSRPMSAEVDKAIETLKSFPSMSQDSRRYDLFEKLFLEAIDTIVAALDRIASKE